MSRPIIGACSVSDLVPNSKATEISGVVSGISIDSRTVTKNELFFACAAQSATRVAHVQESMRRGAVAAVVESDQGLQNSDYPILVVPAVRDATGNALDIFYGKPSRALTVFGVTGTDGKTSVCMFIAQLLKSIGRRCGTIGTLGTELDGHILSAPEMTTPDITDLHARLAQLRTLKADSVALEVSSHALKQQRVAGVHFDTAVFTNLSDEHLDYHTDKNDYLHAKSLLFSKPELSRCVLNGNDEHSAYIAVRAGAECIYYTSDARKSTKKSQVRAHRTRFDIDGISAYVETPWGNGDLRTSVCGHFNLDNILAAIATLGGQDILLEQLLEGMSDLHLPEGRMQFVPNNIGLLIVIDFAHTINGLKQSLQSARALCKTRLWCVFGCGGERDSGKRAPMGAYAALLADCIVLTDDNPRSESSEDILNDILSGMDDTEKVTVIPDRALAIAHALSQANADDCVLIAGKGHERHIKGAGARVPFNDADQVMQCLKTMGATA